MFPKLPTDNGLDDTELAAIAIATRKSIESNQLGASGTVSNAAPTIPITTSSQPCQIEQCPKITIGDTAILKPWSPSEAQSMAKDAPDPLRAPTPFLHWLNQMCTIYSPLPGDLLIILKLAYGSKWQLVRELFHVPQRAEWGSEERGNNISLDIWLDTVCERVVKAEASSQADFSIVTQTIQKPDEAPVDFSQRFRHIWEESAGITMDSNMMFTVQTFINCLNPQTRSLLILTDLQWQEKTLTQLNHTIG